MTSSGGSAQVGEVNPIEAWSHLEKNSSAVLVDVRTEAEWTFVGVPDLAEIGKAPVCVEWAAYPDMSKNPRFVAALMEKIGGSPPSEIFFICRSGARSLRAAEAVAEHLAEIGQSTACFNVAEGFEGDLNSLGHRGDINGWKSRGLGWTQS